MAELPRNAALATGIDARPASPDGELFEQRRRQRTKKKKTINLTFKVEKNSMAIATRGERRPRLPQDRCLRRAPGSTIVDSQATKKDSCQRQLHGRFIEAIAAGGPNGSGADRRCVPETSRTLTLWRIFEQSRRGWMTAMSRYCRAKTLAFFVSRTHVIAFSNGRRGLLFARFYE